MITPRIRRNAGFSLIEVMIAVVVLSFGLLALAALQAGLFRAGAEAKARANATTIAQQVLENARTFAYVAPPAGYAGKTYQDLVPATLADTTIGGVGYKITTTVERYVYDPAKAQFVATAMGNISPSIPEFKQIKVNVSWAGDTGQPKSIEITDVIPAIAPADAIQVVKEPGASLRGPEVWIEPPNKDNPQVVPIAIGDDQSAASSNPKPQQFVQDVSAATQFSVMTFTSSDDDPYGVRLNRKVDVAAVSCVCESGGKSDISNPAFRPTIWNGKQRAYLTPQTAPVDTKIGSAVVSNSTPEIKAMCTVCCRDHHEQSLAVPRVDPWRELTTIEKQVAEEHYGYPPSSGKGFQLSVLKPFGADTGDKYIDACQLIRVNGQMRVGIDAQQSNLLVTPVTGTSYDVPDFIDNYSSFVKKSVEDGIGALPVGYPGPSARFPKITVPSNSNLRLTTPIALTNPGTAGESHKLIAFGLYVDYLSKDTLEAYECASQLPDVTGACAGLGGRNPLETIPFYAVNVANLGEWRSQIPQAATAQNTVYDVKGLVSADGGLVQSAAAKSASAFVATIRINNSNSGLASVFPVDPDDAGNISDPETPNFLEDYQSFIRNDGDPSVKAYSITLQVKIADSTNLSKYNFTQGKSSKVICEGRFSVICTITYPGTKPTDSVITIGNYNSTDAGGNTINRLICVEDSPLKLVTTAVSNDGSLDEVTTLTVHDDTSTVGLAVIDSATCPTGYH